MKSRIFLIILCVSLTLFSCKKIKTESIGGSQSPIGIVGATVTSSSTAISGVSSISGTVTTLSDGVSSFSGSAVITSTTIKNILANYAPAVVSGNNVSITGVKVKFTSEGIESIAPLEPGIIANFSSVVGDTYTTASGKRTVTAVSTTDDFYWDGMYIKIMKVEETPNKFGVKKIIYYSNHKWGLVAAEFTFDDNSVASFPVISSASN
ncbi:MAG: hypothetical protein WCS03_07330 [Bacteroidota bacterium]